MLPRRRKVRIETDRMTLRPPGHADFRAWVALRQSSADFLIPWEPAWSVDHLTRKAFTNRVYWARRSISGGTALPLFLVERAGGNLLGAITLDNIQRGPAQAGTLGYWIGETHARQGFMREAIEAVVHYAFETLDLSRIQAACLAENNASRGLLEKCGFKYEGVAQSYLQINGRWRNHVLYANLRTDRRGRAGVSEVRGVASS
ncbi:MAG: GNAT family protein [Pseudomonadota bacterium]